jgi:hypothetical protein
MTAGSFCYIFPYAPAGAHRMVLPAYAMPLGAPGGVQMHKMLLAIVAIALLLPNGAAVAAESPDVVSCSRFVEHGGMGQPVDKGKAQTMCEDPAYRAKVLKVKASGK